MEVIGLARVRPWDKVEASHGNGVAVVAGLSDVGRLPSFGIGRRHAIVLTLSALPGANKRQTSDSPTAIPSPQPAPRWTSV